MIHLVPEHDSAADRPLIGSLPTGVPGLDAVLRGGIPEFSFNVLAGGSGAGKTTLAQQIVFSNASAERPALYFTVLGEPTLKMIRYQRQFRFFRADVVGSAVRFINLTDVVLQRDLAAVLERIVDEVRQAAPSVIVVDSFRTLAIQDWDRGGADAIGLEEFVQRLALHLATWGVTSFLTGEYVEAELPNPVMTACDGVLWMSQALHRNSVVRKLQVVKMRGRSAMPGPHTFRIGETGIRVFPRIPERRRARRGRRPSRARPLATAVPKVDATPGSGYPPGGAVLLGGRAGNPTIAYATPLLVAGVAQRPIPLDQATREVDCLPYPDLAQGDLELAHCAPAGRGIW